MVLSSGSTSSQSMYRSGTPRRRPRAIVRNGPSMPEAADEPGGAHVHRHDAQLALDLVEAHVVRRG